MGDGVNLGAVAHLTCEICGFRVSLRSHQDCWVDEEGYLGRLGQAGTKVIGVPRGRFQTGTFDSKYCVTCGIAYKVLRMDVQPAHVKRVQFDKSIVLGDAEMACISCKTILLDFIGALELSKNRERAFRVVFKRAIVSENEVLKCPKCTNGKLEVKAYHRE